MINERMSNSLQNIWLKKSKILFFSMFYVVFFILKITDSLIPFFGEPELLKKTMSIFWFSKPEAKYKSWTLLNISVKSVGRCAISLLVHFTREFETLKNMYRRSE